jgi:hypothetical protein
MNKNHDVHLLYKDTRIDGSANLNGMIIVTLSKLHANLWWISSYWGLCKWYITSIARENITSELGLESGVLLRKSWFAQWKKTYTLVWDISENPNLILHKQWVITDIKYETCPHYSLF